MLLKLKKDVTNQINELDINTGLKSELLEAMLPASSDLRVSAVLAKADSALPKTFLEDSFLADFYKLHYTGRVLDLLNNYDNFNEDSATVAKGFIKGMQQALVNFKLDSKDIDSLPKNTLAGFDNLSQAIEKAFRKQNISMKSGIKFIDNLTNKVFENDHNNHNEADVMVFNIISNDHIRNLALDTYNQTVIYTNPSIIVAQFLYSSFSKLPGLLTHIRNTFYTVFPKLQEEVDLNTYLTNPVSGLELNLLLNLLRNSLQTIIHDSHKIISNGYATAAIEDKFMDSEESYKKIYNNLHKLLALKGFINDEQKDFTQKTDFSNTINDLANSLDFANLETPDEDGSDDEIPTPFSEVIDVMIKSIDSMMDATDTDECSSICEKAKKEVRTKLGITEKDEPKAIESDDEFLAQVEEILSLDLGDIPEANRDEFKALRKLAKKAKEAFDAIRKYKEDDSSESIVTDVTKEDLQKLDKASIKSVKAIDIKTGKLKELSPEELKDFFNSLKD